MGSYAQLERRVATLESKVTTLEGKVAALQPTTPVPGVVTWRSPLIDLMVVRSAPLQAAVSWKRMPGAAISGGVSVSIDKGAKRTLAENTVLTVPLPALPARLLVEAYIGTTTTPECAEVLLSNM